MTRTFYLLLGAAIIALATLSSEPAAAQAKYKASPFKPGAGTSPGSSLSTKPPKDHGTSITSMNKKATGTAVGKRQHVPMGRRK